MNKSIITIVMPSYKQGEFINEAITSLISQSGNFYLDIIIHDNFSEDDTKTIALKHINDAKGNDLSLEFENVKFYKSNLNNGISIRFFEEKDSGQYDAINKGIKKMVGNIFSYLNCDDKLTEGSLEHINEQFNSSEKIEWVVGNAYFINPKGEYIGIYQTQELMNKFDITENCFISQPSSFIKASIINTVGGFNTSIKNSSDYEYWLRLNSLGYKFKFTDKFLSSTRLYKDTKTSKYVNTIMAENLALSKKYSGDFIDAHKYEFINQVSFIGRYSWSLINYLIKFRKNFLSFFANFYFKTRGYRAKDIYKKL